VQGIASRKFFGHEAEFNKGTHAVGKETIVDLIDIREVVNGISLRVFVVDTHFVVEDGMETDILEIRDLSDLPEIATITVAQSQDRAAGTKHLLPEVRQGVRRGRAVNHNGLFSGLLGERS